MARSTFDDGNACRCSLTLAEPEIVNCSKWIGSRGRFRHRASFSRPEPLIDGRVLDPWRMVERTIGGV